MKIAIITRADVDKMPGFRYARAFESMANEVNVYDFRKCPSDFSGYNFVIFDDNADYDVWPRVNCPTFAFAFDTGVEGGYRCLNQTKLADHIFYAQKRDENLFPRNKSTWLPHAHDATINHYTGWKGRPIDVSAVGNFDSRDDRKYIRQRVLHLRVGKNIVFNNNSSLQDMANLYSQSKIVLNHNTYLNSLKKKDINLRMFEGPGYGACTFVHKDTDLNGLDDLGFEPHVHYVPYENDDQLLVSINDYLDKPEEIEKIGKAGALLVHDRHTYWHRAKEIIRVYENEFKKCLSQNNK